MLKRKIERRLEKFYSDGGKSALLIDGARQVGKSFIVESFGRSHYESVVVIDFLHQEEAKAIFKDVTDASEILTRITAFSRQRQGGRTLRSTDGRVPLAKGGGRGDPDVQCHGAEAAAGFGATSEFLQAFHE